MEGHAQAVGRCARAAQLLERCVPGEGEARLGTLRANAFSPMLDWVTERILTKHAKINREVVQYCSPCKSASIDQQMGLMVERRFGPTYLD